MLPTPTKRLRLTWAEKVGISDKAARLPTMSYKDIALWAVTEFTLPTVPAKATIHNILHAKSKLLGRSAKDPMDPKSSQVLILDTSPRQWPLQVAMRRLVPLCRARRLHLVITHPKK
ncbi:hypothetical protein PR003_g20656 [Phytophthora rubi]|uniref:ARS-binding protein 1 N-terminal domain-containing protein n=1 Tax=Phytophthora rubi TaxID=129364 RepID=A0A6A3JZB6_9STRA|nr:hypothetical protein PR001_g18840 [Phytophthora rubi]KAE9308804.1 hypothetical protein PR003_g20656 [Phytophthora rubi]